MASHAAENVTGNYDMEANVGSMLAGSWLSTIIYGVGLVWIFRYYQNFYKTDHKLLIALVTLCVSTVAVSVADQWVMMYQYTVTNWGETSFLFKKNTNYFVYLLTATLTGVIVQPFLVHRLWRLSDNNTVLAAITGLLSLGSFATGMTASVAFQGHYHFIESQRGMDKYIISWLSVTTITDVVLAALLLFFVNKKQEGSFLPHTRGIVKQAASLITESSASSAFFTLAALIAFFAKRSTTVHVAIGFNLSALRLLTMLWCLLLRIPLNQDGNNSAYTSAVNTHTSSNTKVASNKRFNQKTPVDSLMLDPLATVEQHQTIQPQEFELDEKRDMDAESQNELPNANLGR